MITITRLYPLHRPIDALLEQQRHIGETVFDSSLHPAPVALLPMLHQSGKAKPAHPSWRQRMAQWYNKSRR